MQAIKKGIKLTISVMGIVLFCACTKEVPVSVIPAESPTPTQEIEFIVTPMISPTEELVSPTKAPTETKEPTVTKEPTKTKEPTATKAPTATKSPTATKAPTATKEPTATKAPTATKDLTETQVSTQKPTSTPIVENSSNGGENLIHNGWQSMMDITQTYYVMFPECFNVSEVIKDENILNIRYKSTQEKNIQFEVLYSIKKTENDILNEVKEQGGIIFEKNTSDGSISYTIEKENVVYQGLVLEKEYKRELLGDILEEDSVVGVMQIVFQYPKEQYAKYETDEFNYYLVKIP